MPDHQLSGRLRKTYDRVQRELSGLMMLSVKTAVTEQRLYLTNGARRLIDEDVWHVSSLVPTNELQP